MCETIGIKDLSSEAGIIIALVLLLQLVRCNIFRETYNGSIRIIHIHSVDFKMVMKGNIEIWVMYLGVSF